MITLVVGFGKQLFTFNFKVISSVQYAQKCAHPCFLLCVPDYCTDLHKVLQRIYMTNGRIW